MIELGKETERVILVGVSLTEQEDTRKSLDELKDLASTAGAETVGTVIQSRDQVHPGTYVGKGKIDEIKDLLWELNATGIICDDELSPVQMKNLQDELDTKVMDRTLVILDIFAGRASTSEGKIQVELAQLKYRQSRLTGFGTAMSRLGGGIGTRGPGEKKLEMDRRLIHERIGQLKRELEDVKRHREIQRSRRGSSGIPVAAIVGYTNAGKSTLLNRLTGAGILAEDKLFATLDPVTRRIRLPSGMDCLLVDTVGFISKLPHDLVDAFQSTLEEALHADLLLIVQDVADPNFADQAVVVDQVLTSLGAGGKPVLRAYNKHDLAPEVSADREDVVLLSTRTGEGVPELLAAIQSRLQHLHRRLELTVPYDRGDVVSFLHKYGSVLEEEYGEAGCRICALVDPVTEERARKMLER